MINKFFPALTAIVGVLASLAFPEASGIYVKQWTWKAEDTRAGEKVGGQILLRACWDQASFSNLQIPGNKSTQDWKDIVENHITQNWNPYAGIRFVFGTSQCDFKIGHADYKTDPISGKKWSPNAIVGNQAKKLIATGAAEPSSPAMWLSWTFKKYSPGLVTREVGNVFTYDPDFHFAAIINQAAHEFGHVLGLVHEQDQPDRPKSCTVDMDQLNAKYEPITKYDPKSIMNYCNPDNQYARQSPPSQVKMSGWIT